MAKYAKFFSLGGGTGPNGLQLPLGTVLDATLRQVQDGTGTGSPLYLSTDSVRIGTTAASAMYWDNTNNRLGVGTSSPISKLQVNGMILSGSGSGDTFSSLGSALGGYGGVGSNYYTIGGTYYRTYSDSVSQLYFNGGGFQFRNATGGGANSAIGFNSQMEVGVGGGGYLTLGTNVSGTINGAKFGILSNGSTSGTKAMIILNSSYDQIFQIQDDGSSTFGRGGSNSLASFYGLTGLQCVIGNDSIQTPSNIYRTTNGQLTFYGRNNNANAFSFEHNNSQQSNASGVSMINIGGGYSTQSDAQFSSLQIVPLYDLNANTTTNSIARGIYYNPTITNLRVAQHRAIETVTGDVLFGTTSGNVGVGTTAPTAKLHLVSNNASLFPFYSVAGNGYILQQDQYGVQLSGVYAGYYLNGTGGLGARAVLGTGGPQGYLQLKENGTTSIYLDGLSPGNAGYSYFLSQLGVGTATTLGAKLSIKGSGSTSATTSLLVQNSGGTTSLQVTDDRTTFVNGLLNVGTIYSGIECTNLYSAIFQNGGSGGQIRLSMGGTNYLQVNQPKDANSGVISGTINTIITPIGYGWSSGSASPNLLSLNPSINNTGTYSGTFRGIYYNPTLTSLTGTTHIALETVTGNVLLGTTSGNVGIGTSSPTARLQVQGSGSTSATKSLLVQNSSAQTALEVYDDKTSKFYNDMIIYPSAGGSIQFGADINNNVRIIDTYAKFQIQRTGIGGTISLNGGGQAQCIYNSNDNGHQFDYLGGFTQPDTFSINRTWFGNVVATTKNVLKITTSNSSALSNAILMRGIYFAPTTTDWTEIRAFESTAGGAYFNTSSVNASAILQADSTTQGFLPPRVTTVQKNAIATPAAGLMVYDTNLARPCFYNGTTWTTL